MKIIPDSITYAQDKFPYSLEPIEQPLPFLNLKRAYTPTLSNYTEFYEIIEIEMTLACFIVGTCSW